MRGLGDARGGGQAAARAQGQDKDGHSGCGPGRIAVVGLGPGDAGLLAPAARAALAEAGAVVGYNGYIDLVDPALLAGKTVVSTGMTGEVARCEAAVEAALAGSAVAVVSSGDAGIYGMAALVLELLERRGLLGVVGFEVVPGIPALCAAASLLGAPLAHDFAVVSLSDLLTPLDVIARRVAAAAEADFVIVLYNPRSRRRAGHLATALEIAGRHRCADTPVGLVRQAFRPGQAVSVSRLADFDPGCVDMLSIVVVGNSMTRIADGLMLTPRGYADKYDL